MRGLLVIVATLVVTACHAAPRAPTAPAAAAAPPSDAVDFDHAVDGKPVAAGPLRRPYVVERYALVLPAGADPARVPELLRPLAEADGFVLRERDTPMDARSIALNVIRPEEAGVAPELVRLIQVKLSSQDIDGALAATTAVRVSLTASQADADLLRRAAYRYVDAVARDTGAWIVDLMTVQLFTAESLRALRRGGDAQGALSTLSMRPARGDDGVFVETAGLTRYGLPDLRLAAVPEGNEVEAMMLVALAADTLIERGELAVDGELAIDLAALSADPWPAFADEVRRDGGTGKVRFRAVWSRGESGASRTPMIDLVLPGDDAPATRFAGALRDFYGASYEVVYAKDDDAELLAARDRARVELAALAPRFARGVPANERLIVKAPFTTSAGGVEWIRLEVTAWSGDTITGTLLNIPDDVPSLALGDRVDVRAGDVFDYVHYRADGSRAGGETDAIIERRR